SSIRLRLSRLGSQCWVLRHSFLLDSILLHFRGERARRDAEEVGSIVARGGATEHLGDLDLLDAAHRPPGRLFQRSGEIDRVAEPVVATAGKAEILRFDTRPVTEDRCTLDAILQLADVAGPR